MTSFIVMSAQLRRYQGHLKILEKARPIERKAFLKTTHPELIKSICECAHNILKGNVLINPKIKKKLYPYRHILRKLLNKKIVIRNKKKFLIQKGGFLPLLLAAIAPIIGSLIGSAIGSG